MEKLIKLELENVHKRYARLILMFPVQLLDELYNNNSFDYIVIEDGKGVDVKSYTP